MMGKEHIIEVNEESDDSSTFSSEESEHGLLSDLEKFQGANPSQLSSGGIISTKTSKEPVSLRGRVHHYSADVRGLPSDEFSIINIDKNDAIDGSNAKFLVQKAVLEKIDNEATKVKPASACVSTRAKYVTLSPILEDKASLLQDTLLVQKACLDYETNCSDELKTSEHVPLSCCLDVDPDAALTFDSVGASLTTYTIDRSQLFPGSVFDSHCHLDFINRRLKGQVKSSVQTLQECLNIDGEDLGSSFGGCVANFCNPSDWGQGRYGTLVSSLIKNSVRDKRVFPTIGCHPHYADRMGGNRMNQLKLLVSGRSESLPRKVVALGECGLDYSKKNTIDKDLQKKVFTDQLKIALQFKLPLVLHIRNAEADGYDVLNAAGVPPNWPIHRHCFTGGWKEASVWLERYQASKIGITGIVTYKEVGRVREVVRNIPLNRLLLETDAPYFPPTKIDRTKYTLNCTLPGHVLHVAAQVAAVKGVQLRTVLEQNLMNVDDIYKVGRFGVQGQMSESQVEIVRAKMK